MNNTALPRYAPMLAKAASSLPDNTEGFAYEVKWDGIRAIIAIDSGKLTIISRNGFDVTFRYPEIHPLAAKTKQHRLILDGEIIAPDDSGHPSFARLQQRMNLEKPVLIQKASLVAPVHYIIFDLLFLDNQSLINFSYEDRRLELSKLNLAGEAWSTPTYHTANAADFFAATRQMGLEGIILKRLKSSYLPGKRSNDWIKVKNFRRQELIISGWTRGCGSRSGTIGALLLGYYDKPPEAPRSNTQQLIYAGSCGTGFSTKTLKQLHELLLPLTVTEPPFAKDPKKANAVYVQPLLVGEFSFAEWTQAGTLRHPSFLGLRSDKDPRFIVREQSR